jgi:acyl-CoA hydrolase
MKFPVVNKTPHEALEIIQSGNRVFVQESAQKPTCLLRALTKHACRLKDVELVFISINKDTIKLIRVP